MYVAPSRTSTPTTLSNLLAGLHAPPSPAGKGQPGKDLGKKVDAATEELSPRRSPIPEEPAPPPYIRPFALDILVIRENPTNVEQSLLQDIIHHLVPSPNPRAHRERCPCSTAEAGTPQRDPQHAGRWPGDGVGEARQRGGGSCGLDRVRWYSGALHLRTVGYERAPSPSPR